MQLPLRPMDSNKFTFGNVLNIAGSFNYRGAAYLSSVSALRVGAGYVTLAAIPPVVESVASQLPDAVYLPLPQNGPTLSKEALPIVESRLLPGTVCSLGCGISAIGSYPENLPEVVSALIEIFVQKEVPFVLDADGLNMLAQSGKALKLKNLAVMTPHPKELSRLLNTTVEDIQKNRIDAARAASKKFETTVLLKGHRTVIAHENDFRINDSGCSALAKAGSGDCLTGIIAGLLAQKMEPFDAAVLGAKIHGLAGEIAASELSEYGVLASDLPRYIPRAILQNQRL
ncbi:MAG: NAD(P)H-hydrate dehydratase [Fibrobacter sp.]|nr:NAD(P)H-hydrate dehydratase [Fibrobacter sp.]